MNKMVFVDIPKTTDMTLHYQELFDFLKRHRKDDDGLDYSILKFKEFWENLDNFGCKEYIFISTKLINNRLVNRVQSRMVIKCIGGECMPKEKSKMVFVDEIPERNAGRTGYDFDGLLNQIPEGKAWKVGEKDYPSIATVRAYVRKHAKEYDAVQRTEDGKRFLFVSKIPE